MRPKKEPQPPRNPGRGHGLSRRQRFQSIAEEQHSQEAPPYNELSEGEKHSVYHLPVLL